jgi:hypothetical protein
MRGAEAHHSPTRAATNRPALRVAGPARRRRAARAAFASIAALALGAPTSALAAPNDFRFNATDAAGQGIFFDESFAPRVDRYARFTTELAYVLAPRLVGPAETLGHAGFGVGLGWSGSFVSASDPMWRSTERATRLGDAPPSLLHTLHVDVRKGLPFSFEVGGSLAWLVESRMMAPTVDVRWALHEGFRYAPDFAARASLTHVIGARDLNLTTLGLDGTLSKGFGVGGVVHLAPYVGWTVMMVAASTRVVDPTPSDTADVEKNFVFPDLELTSNVHHRLGFGVRALFSFLSVGVQGDWEVLKDTADGTQFFGTVHSVRVKLGLEY